MPEVSVSAYFIQDTSIEFTRRITTAVAHGIAVLYKAHPFEKTSTWGLRAVRVEDGIYATYKITYTAQGNDVAESTRTHLRDACVLFCRRHPAIIAMTCPEGGDIQKYLHQPGPDRCQMVPSRMGLRALAGLVFDPLIYIAA